MMALLQKSMIHCLLVLFGILSVGGCKEIAVPELLKIDAISDGVIEQGTRLVVQGRGFPEQQEVELRLHGTLFSPGRLPRPLDLSLVGRSQSISSVRVLLSAAHILEILGPVEHGTFRGVLELRFESQRHNGARLRGSKDVVLDIIGASTASESPLEESARFLAFMGMAVAADLRIKSVQPGSVAFNLGLQVGDHLLGLDEVRVFFLSDLIPRPNVQISQLRVMSPVTEAVALTQFHREDFITYDAEIAEGALLILFLFLSACFIAARPPAILRYLAYPKAGAQGARLELSRVAWLSPGAIFTFLVVLLFSQQLRELGLPLLVGINLFILLFCAFLAGGRSYQLGFRLLRGLAESWRQFLALLPLLGAIILVAVEQGALSFTDFRVAESADGLYIFSSPWGLIAGLSFFLALVPIQGSRTPANLDLGQGSSLSSFRLARISDFSVSSLLSLWVFLFWGRPELSPSFSVSSFLFGLKIVSVLLAFFFLRVRLSRLSLRESLPTLIVPNLLMSVLSGALFLLFTQNRALQVHQDLLTQITSTFALGSTILLIISYFRSLRHWGRETDIWL